MGFKYQDKLNICKVVDICCLNSIKILTVKCFDEIKPFFDKPVNNLKLGISILKKLSNHFVNVNVNEIFLKKYMILNDSDNMLVAFPHLTLKW